MQTIQIEKLIPKFLWNDINGHAMAKAIEAAVNYANDRIEIAKSITMDVDAMPEWVLDERLWECRLTPNHVVTLESKREMVRNMYIIEQLNGTEKALKAYLSGVDAHMEYRRNENVGIDIVLTSDGLKIPDYDTMLKNVESVIPMYMSVGGGFGQSMSLYLNCLVTMDDTIFDRNCLLTEHMKNVVYAALQKAYPPPHTLVKIATGVEKRFEANAFDGKYAIWQPESKVYLVNGVRLEIGGEVIAENSFAATYLTDAPITWVWNLFCNQPDAPNGSTTMKGYPVRSMTSAVVNELNSIKDNMRLTLIYDDAPSVTLNGMQVRPQDDGTDFVVSFAYTALDTTKHVTQIMMHDTENHVYIVSRPTNNISRFTLANGRIEMEMEIYNNRHTSRIGEFIIGEDDLVR